MNEDIKEIIEAVRDSYNETMLQKEFNCYVDMLENCIKYLQAKIEKAVEYIKEDMYSEPNELYGLVHGYQLLDILNGRSDE